MHGSPAQGTSGAPSVAKIHHSQRELGHNWYFPRIRIAFQGHSFSRLGAVRERPRAERRPAHPAERRDRLAGSRAIPANIQTRFPRRFQDAFQEAFQDPFQEKCMSFQYFASAAVRALTARKDGPSLYDICDPLLARGSGGDPHLGQFYRTALGNPALRPLLRRAGLPELNDGHRLGDLREALRRARDDASPDWDAIGRPVAALLDTIALKHPKPAPAPAPRSAPAAGAIDAFIPTYAAFNLIGDPDLKAREFQMALTGLNSRGYKNSTLLFNLARVFIARSPARALINPPWTGIAEPMWAPVQIRHRSAYYDAFFTEALLSFVETGLASEHETAASRGAIADMVEFCLATSGEAVRAADGSTFNVVTALAPPPHPRFSRL